MLFKNSIELSGIERALNSTFFLTDITVSFKNVLSISLCKYTVKGLLEYALGRVDDIWGFEK